MDSHCLYTTLPSSHDTLKTTDTLVSFKHYTEDVFAHNGASHVYLLLRMVQSCVNLGPQDKRKEARDGER